MSDQAPGPNSKKGPEEKDPTKKLDKAMEEISKGGSVDGTLVEIEAHTGQHPKAGKAPDPSVSEALKKAKQRKGATPDIEPAATMYEPTRPGQVSAGSVMATQHGPTEGGGAGASQTPSASGGRGPVAPFGGKIMVGTRVGQIEITGVLGKGGMGEVFKGYHHALDINVAVKVLPDELSRNELVRQRFLREARLCVKLDHAHIVRVFNVDEYAGNLYLVMEMVEGTDAANMLKNGGRFKYKRALEIGAASADALAYAHTQGLVHRDVKPHNILLGATDGKIKLSDFGLARAATSNSHLTMSGQIMGTPHYMSPEQAEAKEVNDKSDVYSLGVTLYHMLTGETPFVGDTPISVAVQHIAKEILFPEIRFTPFPKELVAVLKRMTAKDQAKRCSAKQAAVWLRKLLTMATDDIEAPADAGQTLAPVVRESAAFEAAAKEREARDENAREAARTMLATIQETRKPSTQVPVAQEQPSSSHSGVAVQAGGKGKWVALIVAALVLGGGAAWYFALGGQDFVREKGWIAGEPKGNSGDAGDTGGTTGGTAGGTTGGGTTGGTQANNTPGDTGGESLDPPPRQDDPVIARRLQDLTNAVAATDAIGLQEASKILEQIRLDISSASERQRKQFEELEVRYNRQHAWLVSNQLLDRIDAAVGEYEAKKAADLAGGIQSLNDGIMAREQFEKLTIPPDVAPKIRERRDLVLGKLDSAVREVESQLRADIKSLMEREKPEYDEADKKLELLASLRLPPDVRSSVAEERKEVRTLSLLTKAQAEIRNATYKRATLTLEEVARMGVPKAYESRYRAVADDLEKAIAAAFEGFMAGANKAVLAKSFAEAASFHDKAESLSTEGLLKTNQTKLLAEERLAARIRFDIHRAELALPEKQFNEAKGFIDAAEKKISDEEKKATDDKIPVADSLKSRVSALRAEFDSKLEDHFKGLLTSAAAHLEAKDFSAATRVLVEADELPLNSDQKARRDAFIEQSKEALEGYVRVLVTDIGLALEAGNYEQALKLLKEAEAVEPPSDLVTKLEELNQRFQAEAQKRLKTLIANIETAIRSKRYKDARNDLDFALKIPMENQELVDQRKKLDEQWLTALTTDVDERLKAVDDLMDAEEFKQTKAALAAATPFATLHPELQIKLNNRDEELKRRIGAKFTDLLARAADAAKPGTDDFKLAEQLLAQASAMQADGLLEQAQTIQLSEADDARAAAFNAYIARLFKELEGWASQGLEAEGDKVVAKIEEWITRLDPSMQKRLTELKNELSGERQSVRRKRLEDDYPTLAKYFDSRYTKLEQVKELGSEVTSTFVTADGKFGVAGTYEGKVHFFNLKRGNLLGVGSGGSRAITAVAVAPDGKGGVSGNSDGQLIRFTVDAGTARAEVLGNIDDDVAALVYSPDGLRVYALTDGGVVTQFNPKTGASAGSATRTGISDAGAMAISPDGRLLAIGGSDARVAVFNAGPMTINTTLVGPGGDDVKTVSFSNEGKYLVAGSNGNGVAVWDATKLKEKFTTQYKGGEEWIRGVGFTADMRCVAGFDTDNGITIWDRETGGVKHELKYLQLQTPRDDEILARCGYIAGDGTGLIGTRSGRLYHFTFGSGR